MIAYSVMLEAAAMTARPARGASGASMQIGQSFGRPAQNQNQERQREINSASGLALAAEKQTRFFAGRHDRDADHRLEAAQHAVAERDLSSMAPHDIARDRKAEA
jgi:hypothetical protein